MARSPRSSTCDFWVFLFGGSRWLSIVSWMRLHNKLKHPHRIHLLVLFSGPSKIFFCIFSPWKSESYFSTLDALYQLQPVIVRSDLELGTSLTPRYRYALQATNSSSLCFTGKTLIFPPKGGGHVLSGSSYPGFLLENLFDSARSWSFDFDHIFRR